MFGNHLQNYTASHATRAVKTVNPDITHVIDSIQHNHDVIVRERYVLSKVGAECDKVYVNTEVTKWWPNEQTAVFKLLKPTGHVMHQQFNIQQLYVLPTLYLCV